MRLNIISTTQLVEILQLSRKVLLCILICTITQATKTQIANIRTDLFDTTMKPILAEGDRSMSKQRSTERFVATQKFIAPECSTPGCSTPECSEDAATDENQSPEHQPKDYLSEQSTDILVNQASIKYIDFEVSIQPHENGFYPVSVVASPAGEVSQTMIFPFNADALHIEQANIQHALTQHVNNQSDSTEICSTIERFGAMLFDALISGDIRDLYYVSQERAKQQEKGLRLKLRINDPQVATLPWEFLYDDRQERFLALSNRTPIVRYMELPHPPRPLIAPLPLRILVMIAAPVDLQPLAIEHEKERIIAATQDLCQRGLIEITWLQGQTWRDLQRAMYQGPWHIFHFIGHGGINHNHTESNIVLCDANQKAAPLSATNLGQLLVDHSSLRLVLLNACNSASNDRADLVSGTASTLVQKGIPAVLAMQHRFSDKAAVECARSFYQALAFGLPVDTAVSEARKGIDLQDTDSFEWGIPVLYMRTDDGILYKTETTVRYNPPSPRPDSDAQRTVPNVGESSRTAESTSVDGYTELTDEHSTLVSPVAPSTPDRSTLELSAGVPPDEPPGAQAKLKTTQPIVNQAVRIGFAYGWLAGAGMYCLAQIREISQSKQRTKRNKEKRRERQKE